MIFRLLADLTVLVHFAFILFVVAGVLLVARWPLLWIPHLGAVLWGAYIEFTGTICPLTPLENRFRRLAGDAGYEGGFIEHYLTRVMYPEGLTSSHQIMLGLLVLVLNACGYLWVWTRHPARTHPSP